MWRNSNNLTLPLQGGLKIKFPTSEADKYPQGFDMSLGNFGAPLYGGTLM